MGELTVTSVPRAKKYGPVVRVNVFYKTSVIVTSPESVKVGGAMSGAMSSFPWLVGETGPFQAASFASSLLICGRLLWMLQPLQLLSIFLEVGL